MYKKINHTGIIISGGGTGGHIFPAISIANALRKKMPEVRILFIGAKGKMEMERVPQAGYEIVALPIRGLSGKLSLKNLILPFKLLTSVMKARRIIKKFKPNAVVGVGGYASAPALFAANQLNINTIIQEQNSFPGKTNRWLAKKVNRICVAYDGMEKFFPKDKIVITGNPVRKSVLDIKGRKEEALEFFKLEKGKKIVLFVGGSQGARSINNLLKEQIGKLTEKGLQVIWQTGEHFGDEAQRIIENEQIKGVSVNSFISRMELAYAVADLVVSRAGAIAIAEICQVGLPAVYIPFPLAADDHQTKNAAKMVNSKAALMVKDNEIDKKLVPLIHQIIYDEESIKNMRERSSGLAITDADENIASLILNIVHREE